MKLMDVVILIGIVLVLAVGIYLIYMLKVASPECLADPITYAEKITNQTCGCFNPNFQVQLP